MLWVDQVQRSAAPTAGSDAWDQPVLWCSQYRPKKLSKLVLHQDIGDNLSKLVGFNAAGCQN